MLRIPRQENQLVDWVAEVAAECMKSASDRALYYKAMQNYYDTGTDDRSGARYNAVKPQIERVAGYLYASYNVRFRIGFPRNVKPPMLQIGIAAGDILTAEYQRGDIDLAFGEAVRIACIKGAALLKTRPDGFGAAADVVDPLSIGVMRESLNDLEDQEAVCQISYPTISELWSMAGGGASDEATRTADGLVERVRASIQAEPEESGNYATLVGQLDPLGQPNEPTSGQGSVDIYGGPTPLGPSPSREVVRLVELWIKDPDRGGDYSTIQMVYPDVIVRGRYKRDNIFGIAGRLPYTLVQPRRRPGYLFGQSLIGDIAPLQDLLTEKLAGIARKWRRNVKPPMGFSGVSGNIPESWDQIDNQDGGFMVDLGPQGKADQLTQPVSSQEMEEVGWLLQSIDRQMGFAPVLQGQGESGVRSQGHAETMVRTASPPLLRMAARTERQLSDSGYLVARVLQNEDPRTYDTEDGSEFRLAMLDEDFGVEVDAHSASPAFADTTRQDALLLAQAHAIGAEDLIELLHPPHTELMLKRLKAREAKAEQMAAMQAAQHPPHPTEKKR